MERSRVGVALAVLLPALVHAATDLKLVIGTGKGLWVSDARNNHEWKVNFTDPLMVSGMSTVALAVDRNNGKLFYSHPVSGEHVTIVHQRFDKTNLALKQGRSKSSTVPGSIRGLAYDEMSSYLYWTNMRNHSIWRCRMKGDACEAETFLTLTEEEDPASIAVHDGYLYWTNNNPDSPSVNRTAITNGTSAGIAGTGLFMPNGIAVDATEPGRIYWTDDSEGDLYKIESADLDGGKRRVEYRGHNQVPMDLTFSPPTDEMPMGALYWTDWREDAVWALDLSDPHKVPRLLFHIEGSRNGPMGIVVLYPVTSE